MRARVGPLLQCRQAAWQQSPVCKLVVVLWCWPVGLASDGRGRWPDTVQPAHVTGGLAVQLIIRAGMKRHATASMKKNIARHCAEPQRPVWAIGARASGCCPPAGLAPLPPACSGASCFATRAALQGGRGGSSEAGADGNDPGNRTECGLWPAGPARGCRRCLLYCGTAAAWDRRHSSENSSYSRL